MTTLYNFTQEAKTESNIKEMLYVSIPRGGMHRYDRHLGEAERVLLRTVERESESCQEMR